LIANALFHAKLAELKTQKAQSLFLYSYAVFANVFAHFA